MPKKPKPNLRIVQSQTKAERDAIVNAARTNGAARVRCRDEVGRRKWRSLDQVLDTDIVETDENGVPYTMTGSPGRKKLVVLPASSQTAAQIRSNKKKYIKKDKLVKIAKGKPDSAEVLQQILVGLSEEAASLGFERSEAERRGESSAGLSTKRIHALKAIGETWLRRKEQTTSSNDINLDSPAFTGLFKYIMMSFRAAMEEAKIKPDMSQAVFAKLSKLMDEGWKAGALKAYEDGNGK